MGQGDDRRAPGDEARRVALNEARQRLAEAEALVLASDPRGPEALEQAREALDRSSSLPPPPSAEDAAETNLRERLSAFLRGLS